MKTENTLLIIGFFIALALWGLLRIEGDLFSATPTPAAVEASESTE